MAWQAEQSSLCPGCHLPRDEAWEPEAEGSFDVHVFQCHACAAREAKAAQREKSGPEIFYLIE